MEAQTADKKSSPRKAGGGPDATILIVEDSPVQAELLRRALEAAGYKVIAARDGAAGLVLARAQHPAAVVSDINMPVMDGYALCHAIRRDEVLKTIPVILLTMLSDPQDVIGGLNAGADAYVTKPYNVPSLIARIELLLAHPPPPPPPVERRKLEVQLGGETHLVDAHGPRMLNLLVSTYENAVLQNRELVATQQALEDLNQHLEQKVLEKTAELQTSEQRFRSLIENASDLVTVVDAKGVITYMSPSVKQLGGYESGEVLGTQYLDYVHPDDHAAAVSEMTALQRNPQTLQKTEFRYRHKDGTWITLESVARNALADPAIQGIVVNARDITERKRAAEKIAKLNRLYATLSGINMAIVHSADPAQLFDRVCEVAVTQGKFSMAWIGTTERSDQMMTPVAQRGLSQDDMAAVRNSIGGIAKSRSRAATAIRENRIVYSSDYGAEALAATWRGAVVERSVRGYAALPIAQRGKVVGLLALYVTERNFFDPEQFALLEEMRTDISFAMDRFDTEAKKAQAEAALRESEVRLKAIFDAAADGIVVAETESGRFAAANASLCRMLGYSLDELLERSVSDIHPVEALPHVMRQFELQGKSEIKVASDLPVKRKDGSVFYADVNSTPMTLGGTTCVLGIFRDVTERKQAEEELRRLNWALRALGQSNSALVHAGTEKELFRSCCDAIASAGTYPLAWIGLARDDLEHSIEIAAAAGAATAYLEDIALSWAEAPLGQGPVGTAIRTGATQVIDDLAENVAYQPWIERARSHGLASSVSLPIRADTGPLGALVVFSREKDAFGKAEVELFEELAADIGYGIASRRTREERDHLQQEQLLGVERLKDALIGTIGAVALTVEKRDPYTAGHQQRVAELCVAIGRKLDFAEDRLEGLRLGATIHDIGKIYVPAEILNRPGKLAAVEFEIIKSHPQVGYDIVKDIKFPWPVNHMILQHHERLDGSGYPNALKGEGIIMEARILAVADMVEAMSSHRPYRAGLGIEAALAQIRKEAGSKLDAQVVDACLDLFQKKEFSWRNAA